MKFDNFKEASESGKPFFQVCFYDRREDYTGYTTIEIYSNLEEAEDRVAEMEYENQLYFEKMLDVYSKYGITEDNYRNDNIWNRLIKEVDFDEITPLEKRLFRYNKDAVGYCFIRIHERDLVREEIEEQEYYDKHDKDCEGPYGGAFRDEDDYINWKEGPGFLSR